MTPPAPPPEAPRRVLIVKPSALGDVVTALPVLRGLRRTFPDAHLAWLVSDACAPLIDHDTELNEVVLFERTRLGRAWRSPGATWALWRFLRALRRGACDWVLDLQGLFRSAFFARATRAPLRAGFADAREMAPWFYTHRIAVAEDHTVDRNVALARALGVDARGEDMTLQVADEGRQFAESFLAEAGLRAGAFLVCSVPTRWTTKLYPVRLWRRVVADLSRHVPVVLTGTPGDRAMCEAVAEGAEAGVWNLAGQTGIRDLVGVIAASGGVVCSDSAAKFMAPAVGVDCVTLLGPTRVARTGPYLRGTAIVADVPCQGCLRKRCGHITCMQRIDPREVVSAALTMPRAGVD